jgi:ATP-dependent DNA helicase RecG
MEVSWPGQPFLDRVIQKGDVLLLTGHVRFFHGRPAAAARVRQPRRRGGGHRAGRVLSVYPATEGLSFKQIRTLVESHLDALLPLVTEHLPRALPRAPGVPELPEALRMVHRPASIAEAAAGGRASRTRSCSASHPPPPRQRAGARAPGWRRDGEPARAHQPAQGRAAVRAHGAQTRALREIVADMISERRMHRLLQGDVGSGKTVVALFASLLAMENGYQAAVMAPTELLAEQHHRTFARMLEPLGIQPLLVTGRQAARERREAPRSWAAGAAARGGHARARAAGHHLRPARLRGRRRAAPLRRRAAQGARREGAGHRRAADDGDPDPAIARAHAVRRPRRQRARREAARPAADHERAPPESARERVLRFVDGEVEKGRQAYVVYPLVEESEKSDLKAATVATTS